MRNQPHKAVRQSIPQPRGRTHLSPLMIPLRAEPGEAGSDAQHSHTEILRTSSQQTARHCNQLVEQNAPAEAAPGSATDSPARPASCISWSPIPAAAAAAAAATAASCSKCSVAGSKTPAAAAAVIAAAAAAAASASVMVVSPCANLVATSSASAPAHDSRTPRMHLSPVLLWFVPLKRNQSVNNTQSRHYRAASQATAPTRQCPHPPHLPPALAAQQRYTIELRWSATPQHKNTAAPAVMSAPCAVSSPPTSSLQPPLRAPPRDLELWLARFMACLRPSLRSASMRSSCSSSSSNNSHSEQQ